MVVDGASSHVAKALVVPENIRLHRLPGYSPELNPQEHLWDELREKEFPKPGVFRHGRGGANLGNGPATVGCGPRPGAEHLCLALDC